MRRKEGRERCFHIDDLPTAAAEPVADVQGRQPSKDGVAAVAASSTCLLVGRESGELNRYSLPHLAMERKYTLRARPQAMAVNCDTTRVSIIDLNGVLSLFDLAADAGEVTAPAAAPSEVPQRFERKDVWDMRWADDNAELLAVMEKTRMCDTPSAMRPCLLPHPDPTIRQVPFSWAQPRRTSFVLSIHMLFL